VVLAALLAIAVAGIRSFEDPPSAPTASLSSRDVDRVARRVERLRGLRFTKPIRPLFLDRDQAVVLLERAGRREYPLREQLIDEETAKLLGLLEPSDSVSNVLKRVDQEQVLGFYDDQSKRLVVIRDTGVSRPLLEVTLAHELLHALEDQRFGLDMREGVRDDEAIALASLAEGSATAVMADYAGKHLRLADVLSIADVPEDAGLPEWIEGDELASDVMASLLGELAKRALERVFVLGELTLRNRPRALVLARPEGTAGMREQHLPA